MTSHKEYNIEIIRTIINKDRPRITRPPELFDLFKQFGSQATRESLFVIGLDGQNGLLGIDELYRGTATGTSVRISEIYHPLVHMNAVGFALVHNHPSQNVEPSDADLEFTRDVIKSAKIMDSEFLDHIIVSGDNFTSIRSLMPSVWDNEGISGE